MAKLTEVLKNIIWYMLFGIGTVLTLGGLIIYLNKKKSRAYKMTPEELLQDLETYKIDERSKK